MIAELQDAVSHLRQTKPLVLCLTNYVSMEFMANALLALGCAPIMSVDARELDELVAMSQAVMVNLGTLDEAFEQRCCLVASLTQRHGKPLVLDPVGAGASTIRTGLARYLMPFAACIRGNASEIMALVDDKTKTHGVESTQPVLKAQHAAQHLSHELANTVVISGAEDYLVGAGREQRLAYGSPVMPLVTGMGCVLTAVIAAFHAVLPDSFDAAFLATAYVSLCGSLSHEQTSQPGQFRVAFLDNLYAANWAAMERLL